MSASGAQQEFLYQDETDQDAEDRGTGPYQSSPTTAVIENQFGGPAQSGMVAEVVPDQFQGPTQGAQAEVIPAQFTGPAQSTPAEIVPAQFVGPAQSGATATVSGIAGTAEGGGAGGRAHTEPGGLGISVEGVLAGARQDTNFAQSQNVRWGGQPILGSTEILPIFDAVVDMTDRILIDCTLAPFDTDLTAAWGWPSGVTNFRLFYPLEVLYRPVSLVGVVSDPIFDLGRTSPTFSDSLAGMDLSLGGGMVPGMWKRFLVPDNVEAADAFTAGSVPNMELRLSTSAVATTYTVEVIVRGYYYRRALPDS